MMKVGIAIVTYNRKKYLLKLLNALIKSDYLPRFIYVFDNHSSDGTQKYIYENGFINGNSISGIKFFYKYNSENLGGAGGFYNALKFCAAQDIDAVWAMDDDVLPDTNCLSTLVKNLKEDVGICVPNRTGNGFQDYPITKVNMKNPFLYGNEKKKTKLYYNNGMKTVQVVDMPFEGPLISVAIIKKIGLPNKDLFILYDDSDFAYRANKVCKLLFIYDAHLYKQIVPQNEKMKGMGLSWKTYYMLRNTIWFTKEYGENAAVRIVRPILTYLYYLYILVDTKKFKNKYINIINKAYSDGINNKMGKTIDPSTWNSL